MTPEQRRTYYLAHREEILAKRKEYYKIKAKKMGNLFFFLNGF